MKHLLVIVALVFACIVALSIGSFWFYSRGYDAGRITYKSGPTVEQLESMNHLVAVKVQVSDVLVAEANRWKGSWLIKGDALLAVDMQGATISERDDESRHATITLPPPHVSQPRIDHQRTVTWDVKNISWVPGYFLQDEGNEVRDAAMRQAQLLVEKAAKEHVDEARPRTEALIKSFYSMVGWDIEVRWSDR